jgi:hypothetical protein
MLFEIHGLILALHYEARFPAPPGPSIGPSRAFNNILAAAATGCAAKRRSPFPPKPSRSNPMPTYTPPLRDMQFVMHEVLNVTDELQGHAPACRGGCRHDQRRARRGGKFAAEVIAR